MYVLDTDFAGYLANLSGYRISSKIYDFSIKISNKEWFMYINID